MFSGSCLTSKLPVYRYNKIIKMPSKSHETIPLISEMIKNLNVEVDVLLPGLCDDAETSADVRRRGQEVRDMMAISTGGALEIYSLYRYCGAES
jgi:hypothetical protein